MKKVLIIANQFPPMGGAGVQRTTKFVKYLPMYGIEPIVVTKEHVDKLTDNSLLDDINDKIKIYRLAPYDLVNKKGILKLPLKFIGTRIMMPDSECFWYYFNRKKVFEIIKKEKTEIIYTTSFPYSAHLLGLYIKKKLPKIHWVVDFRDEWTNNPYHLDNTVRKIKLMLERKMEKNVTNNCDYLITNTPFMLKNFVKDNPTLKGKSSYIPNGYDEDDFKTINTQKQQNNKLIITHTGSLYGRRNLTEFLDGLKIAVDSKKIDKSKIEIRIVGNVHQKVLDDYSRKYNIEGVIKSYGYLPHKESIQELYNSDILLLLIGKGKGSENFYTGKLFEYIFVNRPILAIVPEKGAAAQVIKETKTGFVVEPENVHAISKELINLYEKWLNKKLIIMPNNEKIEKYSRKTQTKELSKILKINNDSEEV
ncbi:MAG: glycosyltransferase [Bacilli bacterium]